MMILSSCRYLFGEGVAGKVDFKTVSERKWRTGRQTSVGFLFPGKERVLPSSEILRVLRSPKIEKVIFFLIGNGFEKQAAAPLLFLGIGLQPEALR